MRDTHGAVPASCAPTASIGCRRRCACSVRVRPPGRAPSAAGAPARRRRQRLADHALCRQSSGDPDLTAGPYIRSQYGNWFNVMDPGFNLHLFEPGILSACIVHKPTADGLVSSLELYGPQDKSLLLAFSKAQARPARVRAVAHHAGESAVRGRCRVSPSTPAFARSSAAAASSRWSAAPAARCIWSWPAVAATQPAAV